MNYDRLRALGNYGLIVNTVFGQFFNLQLSLFISVFLSAVTLPYYLKHRLWDTVTFIVFINVVNLAGALNGVPGCPDL